MTANTDGSPSTTSPKVTAVACLSGVSIERAVPTDEIERYIQDPSNMVWMDVLNPGPDELSMLMEVFGFHPLALEDVARGQQRPKIDEYKGYLFVVTYAAIPGGDCADLQTAEVGMFIGRNYLVTVHHGRVPALEEAMLRWSRGGSMLAEGVGFVVYTVMDAIIDAYFPLVDGIEDEVDEIELTMFAQVDPNSVQRLLKLKRTLVALRRLLHPLRETFHVLLRPNHAYFSANTLLYFQSVYDHVLRILDVLEIEREMVNSALEAYLTVVSNRLNRTMKTLTAITVCVAIVGSVFGAWGMNFEDIPWSKSPWGFWYVLGGTIGLIAVALLISLKRKWL